MPKEAQARIKINKLLEAAGWRSSEGNANIALEPHVKLTQAQVDAMGNDFETTSKGFIDFLLLDENGFPLLVLEAKAEDKNPLIGKEQAREYAKSQNCRFVILSNGNLHYHEAGWKNPDEQPGFTQKNRLRFMRVYQQRAAQAKAKPASCLRWPPAPEKR